MAPKVAALRRTVAPDLFNGFAVEAFPRSTLPALASATAAYREARDLGEQFSVLVRDALFEHGRDVSDPDVLADLRATLGSPDPSPVDDDAVAADYREGIIRGVIGSPHFFTSDSDFFCPSLDIATVDDELTVTFDDDGFGRFLSAVMT